MIFPVRAFWALIKQKHNAAFKNFVIFCSFWHQWWWQKSTAIIKKQCQCFKYHILEQIYVCRCARFWCWIHVRRSLFTRRNCQSVVAELFQLVLSNSVLVLISAILWKVSNLQTNMSISDAHYLKSMRPRPIVTGACRVMIHLQSKSNL